MDRNHDALNYMKSNLNEDFTFCSACITFGSLLNLAIFLGKMRGVTYNGAN